MFEKPCEKCDKIVRAISENTLAINTALHLKWHELHPDE